ncbi:MAG: helix-turn-helix domain-containing protein [Chitinivibrionales bacterium]|nr:helix-turn-helix domain-containing protein [Chitinivibrionales bacterium]
MENEILTIEEVARYLRVSERTVYDWAQKGEIPCGRLGSSWRFRREDIIEWVDANIPSFSARTKANSTPRLANVLTPRRSLILHNQTKSSALPAIIQSFAATPEITSIGKLTEGIIKREALMSTGLGRGVAIPHIRDLSIKDIVLAFAHVRPPLTDYESIDDQPIEFIAMIAASRNQHAGHIALLAKISNRLKNENIRNRIRRASDPGEVYAALLV